MIKICGKEIHKKIKTYPQEDLSLLISLQENILCENVVDNYKLLYQGFGELIHTLLQECG